MEARLRDALKARRKALGLSLREVSERSGVSHAAIGHLESGRNGMLLQNLDALATALGLRLKVELEEPGVDRLRSLLVNAEALSASDLAILERMARSLAGVHASEAKEAMALALEALASRHHPT